VKETLKENFDFDAILNQNTGSVTSRSDIYDIDRIALVGDVNLKHKLRYKSFDVKWQEPLSFPQDGILKKVRAEVDKDIRYVKLYVTSYGWQDVKVDNGIVDIELNLKLKNDRTRIILGKDVFTISNKIINKAN
jgi:hypothetical protein